MILIIIMILIVIIIILRDMNYSPTGARLCVVAEAVKRGHNCVRS